MAPPIIEVEDLAKCYRLGVIGSHTLRDAAERFWRTRIRRLPPHQQSSVEADFWALRDVTFNVGRGEVLGIIGRNGAGKSTLLKILSRITEPTSGEVRLRGRVSSLLEVGTGFHPDLSGRENIYLNGAILGMRRAEIARRFDEIVAFAEVSQFLDTPVKHYSSGMYVRLAFAVAAHLEPDILIVDEVLAVGDHKFQQKSLGKMHEIASSQERTVLFVSHNLANIRQLCTSAILMHGGRLMHQGETEDVLRAYNQGTEGSSASVTVGGNGVDLRRIRLIAADGVETNHPIFNQDYVLELVFEAPLPMKDAMIVVEVEDSAGLVVSSLGTVEEGVHPFVLEGLVTVCFRLDALALTPGAFRIRASVYRWFENRPELEVQNAFRFEVQPAVIDGALAPYHRAYGMVRLARGVSIKQQPAVHASAPSQRPEL
jgi:lipopolysaccharide transport system ATP-binding protein